MRPAYRVINQKFHNFKRDPNHDVSDRFFQYFDRYMEKREFSGPNLPDALLNNPPYCRLEKYLRVRKMNYFFNFSYDITIKILTIFGSYLKDYKNLKIHDFTKIHTSKPVKSLNCPVAERRTLSCSTTFVYNKFSTAL